MHSVSVQNIKMREGDCIQWFGVSIPVLPPFRLMRRFGSSQGLKDDLECKLDRPVYRFLNFLFDTHNAKLGDLTRPGLVSPP